jgi:hypothetical protein
MSNKVWSWFAKAAHYVAVGEQDAEKFLATSGALNLISLFPLGGAVQAGIGIFEKALGGASTVERTAAAFGMQSGTGAQKLVAATPDAVEALLQFAQVAGMKVTDQQKLGTIASTIAGAAADFWNILEPVNAPGLPTPATPAAPVAQTAAPAAPKS